MSTLLIVSCLSLALIAGGVAENWLHRRRLNQIPIRVHVNGTRGKSSVTRLIAAGLRAGGIRTCAKATGTLARMIFPDGSEAPLFRPGRTNIIEQKRVVRAAVAHDAQALVIECMAVHPTLQSICELKLVRSTHGVITNAREDHMDVMGPTRLDVARALAGTTPVGGTLFTAESRGDSIQVLSEAAADRGSKIEVVGGFDIAEISSEDMAGFTYLEHTDNVALALRVCESLGVDRTTALKGMWAAEPDVGAMRCYHVRDLDTSWWFVNAFAANDPESTGQNWEKAIHWFPQAKRRIAVINCRVDRPERSEQLGRACAVWSPADRYVITGTGTDVFLRTAIDAGLDSSRLVALGAASVEEVIAAIGEGDSQPTLIMGMGNIAGVGMPLAEFFQLHEDTGRRATPATVGQPAALASATPALVLQEA